MSTSLASPTAVVPLHERPEIQSRRWFLLGIMNLSLVLVVMSVSGLNTALPTIQRDLDASASELQWIVDAYAVLFAGLLLTAGALGDRFGRKRALVAGLIVFAISAVLGGLAQDATQVIASRALMGVGAAFVMPATLSIITSIFAPHERAKAIAIWAGFAGAGASLGPILTGGLLEGFWWGSTLLVNVPIALAVVAAVWWFAPDSRDETHSPLDFGGALFSLAGLSTLIFGIIQGRRTAGRAGSCSLFPGVGSVAVAVRVVGAADRASDAAARAVRQPALQRGQRRHHRGVLRDVRVLLPHDPVPAIRPGLLAARGGPGEPAAGAHVRRGVAPECVAGRALRRPPVMAAGLGIVAVGFAAMTSLTNNTPYFVIAVAFAVLGAGMGMTAAPGTGEIMSSVPLSKAGVGSAVNDTTRELGAPSASPCSAASPTPRTGRMSTSTASDSPPRPPRRPANRSAPPPLWPVRCPTVEPW